MLQSLKAGGARWLTVARRVYLIDVLWRALREFQTQGGTTYAAAISYYVLFSLFPLLIFLVAAFGLVVRDSTAQDRVVNAIIEQIPPEINLDQEIDDTITSVAETSSGLLGLVGLLGTAWTASGMFGALRRAINRAFDSPGMRPFVRGKVMDLAGVVGVMGLALLSILATSALGMFRALADDLFSGVLTNLLWGLVYILLPFGFSFVTFLVVYRVIPYRSAPLLQLWPGALLAAVGFELTKAGFGLYVANFGRYQEVYGALGGVVAFLFFVFIVSNIVIFVAEFTSELIKDRSTRAAAPAAD